MLVNASLYTTTLAVTDQLTLAVQTCEYGCCDLQLVLPGVGSTALPMDRCLACLEAVVQHWGSSNQAALQSFTQQT